MQCRVCEFDNRYGVRFCEGCGVRLDGWCAACGSAVAPPARFCGACGHPLAPAASEASASSPWQRTPDHLATRILTSRTSLEGERKQVTVLLADMRGSLELMSGMDPDEARQLLDPVLALMMDAVHHQEGTVNQVLGDGIMALFGAPLAHEDHAVRACLAALDMQEATARHARTLPASIGSLLKIRIGLNSGDVVVRSIGNDLHMDFTAIGQTTHLAGRMEQLARPGSIYVTAATARLVEGIIEVAPLGPTAIKGLAEPVDVLEVTRAGPHRTRLDATRARALTRFIGREAELAALRRAAEQAAAGHGQLVAIVGEPGVGKSRLVLEFTRAHCRVGWALVETGTVVYRQSRGRTPMVDLVWRVFDIDEDDDQAAIVSKVEAGLAQPGDRRDAVVTAVLGTLDPTLGGAVWQGLDPDQRRQHMLDAVTRVLLEQASAQPLCLVVEDLHWADSETQALLDRLVDLLPTTPLLLVVTYRPEYRHDWTTRTYYAQLPIEPLERSGAEALLRDLLGSHPSLAPIVELLIERTDGNPFFLEESVRDLVEKHVLAGEPRARHALRLPPRLDVPPSVQAVLASRIDRLPPAQKELLQIAAVIGKDVPLALLEAAVPSTDRMHEHLRALHAAELLYEGRRAGGPELTFKHVLTRDVAYGSLVADRRRAIHASIVEEVERVYADRLGDHVERLALHATRGELWGRAVAYCRDAGRRAFTRSAHRLAVEYFEQALAALRHLPSTVDTAAEAIDLHLDLRYALMPLGEFERMYTHLTEAGEQARAAGDQRRLGLVSAFLTNYYHLMGDLARAVETGEQARSMVAHDADPQARILLNAYLGWAYLTQGRYDKAIEVSRANVAMLTGPQEDERFGSASLPSVYSRTCLAWALAELGTLTEAETVARQGLLIAEKTSHTFSLVYACLGLGTVYLRAGDHASAITVLERGLELCREADIPLLPSMAALPLTSAYALAGRGDAAVRMLDDIGRLGAAISDPVERRVSAGALAEAYLVTGRPAEALPLARTYLDQRRRFGARGFEGWALKLLADVVAADPSCDASEAQRSYREALAIAEELRMRPLEGMCLLALGRLLDRGGRVEEARAATRRARDCFTRPGMERWRARLDAEVGEV